MTNTDAQPGQDVVHCGDAAVVNRTPGTPQPVGTLAVCAERVAVLKGATGRVHRKLGVAFPPRVLPPTGMQELRDQAVQKRNILVHAGRENLEQQFRGCRIITEREGRKGLLDGCGGFRV